MLPGGARLHRLLKNSVMLAFEGAHLQCAVVKLIFVIPKGLQPRGICFFPAMTFSAACSGVHNCRKFLDHSLAPEVLFCYVERRFSVAS
jgi:hypothetical protein